MSKYQIRKEKKVYYDEIGNPFDVDNYIIAEAGADHLILEPGYDYDRHSYNQNIGQIFVLSNKYKTKEGIGINSTISEFQNVYPEFSLWATYEGSGYVIQKNKKSKIQFALNPKDFLGDASLIEEMTTLKTSDFRNNSKITKIRIY